MTKGELEYCDPAAGGERQTRSDVSRGFGSQVKSPTRTTKRWILLEARVQQKNASNTLVVMVSMISHFSEMWGSDLIWLIFFRWVENWKINRNSKIFFWQKKKSDPNMNILLQTCWVDSVNPSNQGWWINASYEVHMTKGLGGFFGRFADWMDFGGLKIVQE